MSENQGEPTPTWRPVESQRNFIRDYARALESGDAALFAGAGLSQAAGYVDWRHLLAEIADDLELDINRESDLVAVAQYYFNARGSRGRLNQVLIDELTNTAGRSPNHELLARLPIPTVWTTNYDLLLEEAFKEAGKVVDVKVTQENLAQTRRGRDVVLYKMHGCVTQPQNAVITRDDYEKYDRNRQLFVESLKGDLISKTFMFLGFSFSDPNIDYILSRVRVLLGENVREHFCIMRRAPRSSDQSGPRLAEFEYEERKAELRKADLRRFGVHTVWIDEYSDLERLLRALTNHVNRKSVFVAGAAAEWEPLGRERLEGIAQELGHQLIEKGFRFVSGFGYGLGGQCILGALGALRGTKVGNDEDRLIIRPFPRAKEKSNQTVQNTRHREELLSRAGVVVVIGGNKRNRAGDLVLSDGILEEVEIARRLGKVIVPIGATGHAARQVWQQAMANPTEYLQDLPATDALQKLGDESASNEQLLTAVFEILNMNERAASGD